MSRPYRINWVASNPTGLGAAQTYTANSALILNATTANMAYPSNENSPPWPAAYPAYYTVPATVTTAAQPGTAIPQSVAPNVPQVGLYGPINYNGVMPQDNVRIVTLTGSGGVSSASVNFSIYGLDETGMFIQESVQSGQAIAGPASGSTVSFRRHYYKILAIIPSANAPTNALVSVGWGGIGYTVPFQADYWRKQMQMSFAIENYVAGTTSGVSLSVLPEITNDQGQLFQKGYMVPQPQKWFVMPGVLDEFTVTDSSHPPQSGQGQLIIAPTDATPATPTLGPSNPITQDMSWSLRSYPIVGARVLVNDATFVEPSTGYPAGNMNQAGTFTFVVIQQGGR